jgi:hypothetical protein
MQWTAKLLAKIAVHYVGDTDLYLWDKNSFVIVCFTFFGVEKQQ